MPLGLATRVSHPADELTAALQELAAGATLVVEAAPVQAVEVDVVDDRAAPRTDEAPSLASAAGATRARRWPAPSSGWPRARTPAPLREATVPGRRAEVTVDLAAEAAGEPTTTPADPARARRAAPPRQRARWSRTPRRGATGTGTTGVHPLARGGAHASSPWSSTTTRPSRRPTP